MKRLRKRHGRARRDARVMRAFDPEAHTRPTRFDFSVEKHATVPGMEYPDLAGERPTRPVRLYGRAMGPQAITRPAGSGMVDVLLVDSKGTVLRTLARGVSRSKAKDMILGGAS